MSTTATTQKESLGQVTRRQKEEFLGLPVMQKMLSVGLSDKAVKQRLATFLQVPTDTPVVARATEAIATGAAITAADVEEMVSLAGSKYDRMQKRGAPREKVEKVRMWESHSVRHIGLVLADLQTRGLTTLVDTPVHMPRSVNTIDTSVGDYGIAASARSIARTVETQATAEEGRRKTLKEAIQYVEEKLASVCNSKAADIAAAKEGLTPAVGAPDVISSTAPFVHPLTGISVSGRTHLEGRILSSTPIIGDGLCKDIIARMAFSEDEVTLHQTTAAAIEKLGVRVVNTAQRRPILDADVAALVWKAVKNILPQKLDYGLVLDGVRTQMSFDCYPCGAFFDTHSDAGHRMVDSGDISVFSFLLHLNGDYEGGELQFCDVDEWSGEGSDSGQSSRQARYTAGELALFSHDTVYRSAPVTSGSKYVIQGMVMYRHTRVSGRKEPARFRTLARAY